MLKKFLLISLFMFSTAHADFDIQFYSDPGLSNLLYSISDNGTGDSDLSLGQITTGNVSDLTALNTAVQSTGIQFSTLAATNNASDANDLARLLLGGSIQLATGASSGELYVQASANDYFAPPGPEYSVNSFSANIFTAIGSGAPTFVSYFNDGNVLNSRQTPTGVLIFAPPPGDSTNSLAAPSLLVSATVPFGLTNVTKLQLNGSRDTVDQFIGSTVVRAVPEPGSFALILIGGGVFLYRRFR